jgi:hypothetical protein
MNNEITNQTRLELENMIICIDPDTGKTQWALGSKTLDAARFKHVTNQHTGLMTVKNALAGKFIIKLDGGGEESYKTVDAFIDAGWILD